MRPVHHALAGAAALLLAWGVSFLPVYQRVSTWLVDTVDAAHAPDQRFAGAVHVDIDDASHEALKPHLGPWPYERAIYGLVLDWLHEQGARQVVFDILFADPRPGDAAFAAALRRHGGVLIATAGSSQKVTVPPAPTFAAPLPAMVWDSATLPAPELLAAVTEKGQLALAAAREDGDGRLRRLPLVQQVGDARLPSPPLAALLTGEAPRFEAGRLHLGVHSWPVDAAGAWRLMLPKHLDAVPVVPFRQLAEAALGLSEITDAKIFFAGKTVFIGSTLQLSDRVSTSRGTLSGTQLLALAHQSLMQGYASSDGWWACVLPGALLVVLLMALWLAFARYRDLHAQRNHLAQAASTDTLTGLLVRRAFLERYAAEAARAARQGSPFCMAILDLDHFKRVNDTYSHATGDLVLKTFAGVLTQTLRASDIAGRWGGEEFVLLMPDTPLEAAQEVLERVRETIQAHAFEPPASALKVTMSAGLTPGRPDADAEALVDAADQALYAAKEGGRNQVRVA